MADATGDAVGDAEAAVERLEAALERIARHAGPAPALNGLPEVRDRLDRIIGRLRAALAEHD